MPRLTKTKLAISAAIVLLAAGAGGYQIWAQHQARMDVDAALANLPAGGHGQYSTMSFNAFTRTLRLRSLAITHDGHPWLSVEDVTLHHLSGGGTRADPFEASYVRLIGVTLRRGSRSMTVSRVDGQSIAVLAPGVTPPPGTPSWLASPDRATLLSAASLTATTIADDEGTSLAGVSIADYDNGQIGQATARSFADANGNRIASAEAAAVSLGGLDDVFDTARYHPGKQSREPLRPLIGHAALIGVQSHARGVSGEVGSMTLDGFAARPFEQAPNTAYVNSPAFLTDAASAMSLGNASLSGLHYTDSKENITTSLTSFSLSGYADGALGLLSMNDLAVSGSDDHRVTVARFQLTGLNATKLLHSMPGDSTSGYSGVRLAGLAIDHVSFTFPPIPTISLDSLTQTTTGGAPMRFTAQLRNLRIPAQSTPELAQALGGIGVDPLVLDMDEAGSYDLAKGALTVAPMAMTARQLGTLSVTAQFTNLPHDLSQSPDAALAALANVGIGPFTIRFTNDSLVQRVIAMQARQAGKTPEEITDEAKLAASFGAAALVPQQPDAGDQVAAFLASPKTLTITATPTGSVPIADLLGAEREAAQSALNLRLSAN